MPVIRAIPQDPTDIILSGELMRDTAFELAFGFYLPMQSDFTFNDSRARLYDGISIRANSCISTPCGNIINMPIGENHMINPFIQDTSRWVLNLHLQDTSAVNVADARVLAMEVGRLEESSMPIVTEGISDASGNLTLEVPLNLDYFVTAYKIGSPDSSGTSVINLRPTQV